MAAEVTRARAPLQQQVHTQREVKLGRSQDGDDECCGHIEAAASFQALLDNFLWMEKMHAHIPLVPAVPDEPQPRDLGFPG